MSRVQSKEGIRVDAEARFRKGRRKVLDALQAMRDMGDEWPGVGKILEESGVVIDDDIGGSVTISLDRLISAMRTGLDRAV